MFCNGVSCFSKFNYGGDFVIRFDPCEAHAGGPSKYCCYVENPTPSKTIKSLVDWLDKESQGRGYQVKEKSFILPQDLLALQVYVYSVNYNMWDLQNYVVLLARGGVLSRLLGGLMAMEIFTWRILNTANPCMTYLILGSRVMSLA